MADAWQSWAAGILPTALHPVSGSPMVLLGRDSRSKGGHWSDFAGGGEAEDATPCHTAIRELAEETGGLLRMAPEDLRGALEFRGTTPSGKTLYRYIVPIAYDASLPGRFTDSHGGEKTAVAWFHLGALPPMRRVFWQQMRADQAAIARFITRAGSRAAGCPGDPRSGRAQGHTNTDSPCPHLSPQ